MNHQLSIVSINDTASSKMKKLPRNDKAAHSGNHAKDAELATLIDKNNLGDRNSLSLPRIVRYETQQ